MPTKVLTDRGENDTAFLIERIPGGPPRCAVHIRTSNGLASEQVVDLATTLTGPERTALAAIGAKLYQAALASAGFA